MHWTLLFLMYPLIPTLSWPKHVQDINDWELKHILSKHKPKQAEIITKELGFLDASLDFFLVFPRSGLRHMHMGSEAQVSPHNNSFQFGKIEEIGDLGPSPVETHLFH